MSVKAKLLLSLALLRELHNKVEYYKSVVQRNIYVYKEYKEHSNNYDKAKAIEKELISLENIYKQLNNIDVFLEYVILRLETLITANNIALSIAIVRDIVKILKGGISRNIPILVTLIDKLDEISRALIAETQNVAEFKNAIGSASHEAKKIIDEAKRVAEVY
jgi:division protein CdvB (Snf7/Vps24/ESCRT-III family)